jgi:hypothetical protein
MAEFTNENLVISLMLLVSLAIYIIIIIIFMSARKKYQGGIIEKVINMIISTIGLMLVADLAIFLVPVYGFTVGYQVHVVFKIIAMTFLAVGGLKFFAR